MKICMGRAAGQGPESLRPERARGAVRARVGEGGHESRGGIG